MHYHIDSLVLKHVDVLQRYLEVFGFFVIFSTSDTCVLIKFEICQVRVNTVCYIVETKIATHHCMLYVIMIGTCFQQNGSYYIHMLIYPEGMTDFLTIKIDIVRMDGDRGRVQTNLLEIVLKHCLAKLYTVQVFVCKFQTEVLLLLLLLTI